MELFIGTNVYNERKRVGMSKDELATKLNCTKKEISDIEDDVQGVTSAQIDILAKVFKISVNELVKSKKEREKTLKRKIFDLVCRTFGIILGITSFILSIQPLQNISIILILLSIAVTLCGLSLLPNQSPKKK